MKVAVFTSLVATSAVALDGTRFAFYSTTDCTATTPDATYPVSEVGSTTYYTKLNVDAVVYMDDGDNSYVKLHTFQYFPETTDENVQTPDNAYANDDLTVTNLAFRTDQIQAFASRTYVGRTIFLRADYDTGNSTADCVSTKNEDGSYDFDFKLQWSLCTDSTCSARRATTSGDDSIDLLTRETDGGVNYDWNGVNSDMTISVNNGEDKPLGEENFMWAFDGVTADVEGAPKSCFDYSNNYNTEVTGTGATASMSTFVSSSYSARNLNVQPDAVADTATQAESELVFTEVFKKMCSDSTRVAQVAALSIASVAAGLVSFF